jgi:4-hydroxythreonine-4-phosphate dehydrogenase
VLILADDLSGAADCAVTGARLGLRSHVVLHQEAAAQLIAQATALSDRPVDGHATPQLDAAIDVLAIDLDCRRQSPLAAAQIHTVAWQTLGHPAVRLYKKVDSTLRGNVASEIAALTAQVGMAIVAPAFPSAGRTTVGARQLLHGTPLEETEVWRNEHIPGRADLMEMLSSAGLRVLSLSLNDVRASSDTLGRQFVDLQASGIQAVICDAQTDDDLYQIAHASIALQRVFWVGSAGLAREWLVEHEHREDRTADNRHVKQAVRDPSNQRFDAAVGRPVLAVVGSMSSISHAQVAALHAEAGEAMFALEIDTQALLADVDVDVEALQMSAQSAQTSLTMQVTAEVAKALAAGRDVLVSLSQKDRTRVADGLLLCEALARLLAPVVPLAGTVIATGGETARALLGAATVHSLQIVDEIEHGVPLMHARQPAATSGTSPVTSPRKLLQVITKAGGFGTPQTLITAWRRASTSCGTPDSRTPLISGPALCSPAPGAEDRPFHKELTQ